MTREETKKAIEVMQAYCDGKAIQCRSSPKDEWTTLTHQTPSWEWSYSDYRIKPEPMEIEVWVKGKGEFPVIPTNSAYAEPAILMEQKGWTKKKFREVV